MLIHIMNEEGPSYLQTSKISKNKILKEFEKSKRTTVRDYKKRWNSIRASRPLEHIQADKLDFGDSIGRLNGGYRYYNVIIDVFSRFVWIDGIKRNDPNNNVAKSTIKIINEMKEKYGIYPSLFTSDNEYKNNNQLTQFFNRNNIKTFFSQPNDEQKRSTPIVERVIGTIRRMVGMWQRLHNQNKFHNNIQDIIYAYNYKIKHTTIGTNPGWSLEHNVHFIKPRKDWNNETKPKVYEYKVGDKVRLSKLIELDRNYNVIGRKKIIGGHKKQNLQNYSSEVYTIDKVHKTKVDLKYKNYSIPNIRKNDIILSLYNDDSSSDDEKVMENEVKQMDTSQRINRRIRKTGISQQPFGVKRSELNEHVEDINFEDPVPSSSPSPSPSPNYPEQGPSPEPPSFINDIRKEPEVEPVEPTEILSVLSKIIRHDESKYTMSKVYKKLKNTGISLIEGDIDIYFDKYKEYEKEFKLKKYVIYRIYYEPNMLNQVWFGPINKISDTQVKIGGNQGRWTEKIDCIPFNHNFLDDEGGIIIEKLKPFIKKSRKKKK